MGGRQLTIRSFLCTDFSKGIIIVRVVGDQGKGPGLHGQVLWPYVIPP